MVEESGEVHSPEELIRRYLKRVYGFCRTMLRDERDVEDACQEVFLTVVRQKDRLEAIRRPLPWLMKVSRLTCLWIRRKRRPGGPLEDVEIDDPEPGPSLEQDVNLGRIREATERIPERYRAVLAMHYQQGMSQEEIAESMEISPGALRVLLHRAVGRLRGEVRKPCAR